jgi:colanic acid/amylovoran biosynthesis protein
MTKMQSGSQINLNTFKAVRIAVLGARFESDNMGINALAFGAVKCILAGMPRAEIQFIDYAEASRIYTLNLNGRDRQLPLVNFKSLKRPCSPEGIAATLALAIGLRIVPNGRLRRWIVARHKVLRALDATDIAASFAEGDSFSDIYGVYRFIRMALPLLLVLLMGKRLVLMPQTIGPFRNSMVRLAAGFILRRAESIHCRDKGGLDETEALIGKGLRHEKARFNFDVGFVLDPSDKDWRQALRLSCTRPLIGLNVSGLLYMGGYTRSNMFGLKSEYRSLVRAIISEFILKRHATVLLVPHVFGSTLESDAAACQQLFEELRSAYGDRILLASQAQDARVIKSLIGTCDFFIGSRMHSCIAALSQCIPTVSIAYSRKFIGVMEAAGCGALVVDARELRSTDLLRRIGDIFERRVQIHQELCARIPKVQQSVLTLFSNIRVA